MHEQRFGVVKVSSVSVVFYPALGVFSVQWSPAGGSPLNQARQESSVQACGVTAEVRL